MEGNPQLQRVTVQEFSAKYQSKIGKFSATLSNTGIFYRGLQIPEQ